MLLAIGIHEQMNEQMMRVLYGLIWSYESYDCQTIQIHTVCARQKCTCCLRAYGGWP